MSLNKKSKMQEDFVKEFSEEFLNLMEDMCEKHGFDPSNLRHSLFFLIKDEHEEDIMSYAISFDVDDKNELITMLDAIEDEYDETIQKNPLNWFSLN